MFLFSLSNESQWGPKQLYTDFHYIWIKPVEISKYIDFEKKKQKIIQFGNT